MIWFWYFLQFGGSTTRNDEHWRTSVAVMYRATWRWALRLWLKTSDFSRDEKTTSLMWKLGYSRVLIHCHLFSRLMQWCRLKPQKWACSRGSGTSKDYRDTHDTTCGRSCSSGYSVKRAFQRFQSHQVASCSFRIHRTNSTATVAPCPFKARRSQLNPA